MKSAHSFHTGLHWHPEKMIKKRRLKEMSYHNLNNYIKLQMKCTIFPTNMGAVLSKGGVEEGGGGVCAGWTVRNLG